MTKQNLRDGVFNIRNRPFWINHNPHMVNEMGFEEKLSLKNVFAIKKVSFMIYEIH